MVQFLELREPPPLVRAIVLLRLDLCGGDFLGGIEIFLDNHHFVGLSVDNTVPGFLLKGASHGFPYLRLFDERG